LRSLRLERSGREGKNKFHAKPQWRKGFPRNKRIVISWRAWRLERSGREVKKGFTQSRKGAKGFFETKELLFLGVLGVLSAAGVRQYR
jgi:hypothetical protein